MISNAGVVKRLHGMGIVNSALPTVFRFRRILNQRVINGNELDHSFHNSDTRFLSGDFGGAA